MSKEIMVLGWSFDGACYTLGPVKVLKEGSEIYVAYIGKAVLSKTRAKTPGDLLEWLSKVRSYLSILEREGKVYA